jgi:hypothetical protein
MPGSNDSAVQREGDELSVNPADFTVVSLADEIRVDNLWTRLLRRFYDEQLAAGVAPQAATQLAGSADYFVRDFVVAVKQHNLLLAPVGLVRQFAGNWYIVSTLEPTGREIEQHLTGITAFIRFLQGHGLIDAAALRQVEEECAALDYYRQRIDTFWAIEGDGYLAWEQECSLKKS